jgi:hypothetical protein
MTATDTDEPRGRLFTNVSYVALHDPADGRMIVRMNCSALLLAAPMRGDLTFGFGISSQARALGFGPHAAWPVFTRLLGCGHLDYEVEGHEGNVAMLKGDGTLAQISGGSTLRFKDGTLLLLQIDDYEQPIRVQDVSDTPWCDDELLLTREAAEFHRAPYFPTLHHVPVEDVRALCERARATR